MGDTQNKSANHFKAELNKKMQVHSDKYKHFFRYASDAIVMANEQGEIIEWNPAQEQLSGLTFDQVRGKKYGMCNTRWPYQR